MKEYMAVFHLSFQSRDVVSIPKDIKKLTVIADNIINIKILLPKTTDRNNIYLM